MGQASALPYYNTPCATWSFGGYPSFLGEHISVTRSVEECAKYAIDNDYAGFTTAWQPKAGYAWEDQSYANPECDTHCEFEILGSQFCWMADVSGVSECGGDCTGLGVYATYTVTTGTECQVDEDGIYKESKTSLAPTTVFQGRNYTIG
eukprot:CAMPEP_0194273086 /NCGR_PEP_ID=MMETSP0169-20130528/6498_1 /TAXON_ID=218684 /ORGANISM="Corethron pennatum, Strain L29A3" /LENGTH=148 /DNA_ID=CAMNT_0039015927 /DNA_START=75 /DNA_END=517 /DNA_ORIENTATION=+